MISLHKAVRRVAVSLVLVMGIAASGYAFAQSAAGNGGHAPGGGPSGHASSAPTYGGGAPGAGSCGGGLSLPAAPNFQDVNDTVKDLSRDTQAYIRDCGCVAQACIADALDEYARALAEIAPRLPPRLQNAPEIIATAARRVRIARTKKEALTALNDAMAAIHKDIELVKAEDPNADPRNTRGGDFVVETLSVASLSLEKGGGL